MPKRKINIFPVVLSVLLATFSVGNVFAEEDLSDARKTSISTHCSSIKDALKATQHADSHARTHLGSIYEAIINNFVTPLNVRLIKANKASSDFTNIQTDLVNTREKFNSSFIDYSKSLEDLINTDCANSPSDFYKKLQTVRKERATVDEYSKKMSKLISSHKQKVTELEETL